MQQKYLVLAVAALSSTAALAQDHAIEELTIVGSQEEARQLAGSGSVIDV